MNYWRKDVGFNDPYKEEEEVLIEIEDDDDDE